MAEDSQRPIRTNTTRRGARRGMRRSRTLVARKLTREEAQEAQAILDSLEHLRPRTRSDCRNAERPCPYVSCKYHLYLDINPQTGSVKLNFPDLEVWEMPETCALDVADRGGITLEDVGSLLNLTRERIRQVELSGLKKLRAHIDDPTALPELDEDEDDEGLDEDDGDDLDAP